MVSNYTKTKQKKTMCASLFFNIFNEKTILIQLKRNAEKKN